MEDVTTLQLVWFLLISVLWIGYFILEGFDFGVGMLIKLLGRDNNEKRAILHTIGPVWDGNEVWLIVAGGATFAAFPEWYATLFSGFYIALFAILVALIVRNVGFELWGKRDSKAWRSGWEWCIALGSLVPALLWGVAWANLIGGVPIETVQNAASGRESIEYVGSFFDLLKPYALLGGLATLAIFFTHGALFLEMKTKGGLRDRARKVAVRSAPAAVILPAAFLIWTIARQDPTGIESLIFAVVAIVALAVGGALAKGSPGKAFASTVIAIIAFFTALFTDLFPNAMVSSIDTAQNLTLSAASSSNYTLTVMTVVAVLLVPVVLLYQAWTYWVFRQRVGAEDFDGVKTPLDLLDKKKREADGDGGKPADSPPVA
ncbi:MAG: cytochrome d ubiquinol oxidase subunit II [Solirubrobacterales bacterium]|nr:cytochrome d ubiquinol oxidase subunit II [Solirubrobacterales bacterium]